MLTINALACADTVLIPVQAAYLPVKGLQQLIRTITRVKRQLNTKLEQLHEFKNHPFHVVEDEAVIVMVDANIQREEILPSERAFAFKMKMEAMSRKGNDVPYADKGNDVSTQ